MALLPVLSPLKKELLTANRLRKGNWKCRRTGKTYFRRRKKGCILRKKEALIEGKDEIHKLRLEADRDIKERRNEANRMERRLQQKEETLDRKLDNFEKERRRTSYKTKLKQRIKNWKKPK